MGAWRDSSPRGDRVGRVPCLPIGRSLQSLWNIIRYAPSTRRASGFDKPRGSSASPVWFATCCIVSDSVPYKAAPCRALKKNSVRTRFGSGTLRRKNASPPLGGMRKQQAGCLLCGRCPFCLRKFRVQIMVSHPSLGACRLWTATT